MTSIIWLIVLLVHTRAYEIFYSSSDEACETVVMAQATAFACPEIVEHIYPTSAFLRSGPVENHLIDSASQFTLPSVSLESGEFAESLILLLSDKQVWRVVEEEGDLTLKAVYWLNTGDQQRIKSFRQFNGYTLVHFEENDTFLVAFAP